MPKKIESFEDLLVWQKGMKIVKQVYLITRDGKLSKDFGLRDQLRGAALSIPSNIAELITGLTQGIFELLEHRQGFRRGSKELVARLRRSRLS